MKRLWYKKMVERTHVPSRHDIVVGFEHLIHDERFWVALVAAAFVIAFIVLVIWAGLSEGPDFDKMPGMPPFYGF